MRKPGKCAVLFAIALMAVGLVMLLTRSNEPSYEGKRLSEWVERLSSARVENEPEARSSAGDAIGHIGTNAMPYLLSWMRYERPFWKWKSFVWIKQVFSISLTDWRAERAESAAEAISCLGPGGEKGIPTLALMMNDNVAPTTALRATRTLSGLGYYFLSASMALMTNRLADYRSDGITKASHFATAPDFSGVGIDAAVPMMVQCLKDTDEWVVMVAGSELGRKTLAPKLVVPALVENLQDQRFNVRGSAARALGDFRADAASAVLALRTVLLDPDSMVRAAASNSLRQIAPEVVR